MTDKEKLDMAIEHLGREIVALIVSRFNEKHRRLPKGTKQMKTNMLNSLKFAVKVLEKAREQA